MNREALRILKARIESWLKVVHLYDLGQYLFHQLILLKRKLLSWDRRLIDTYLSSAESHNLHIGCGDNLLPGWLNCDYFPSDPKRLHLDASRAFPLDSDSFDHIYTEHVIEHLDYAAGMALLSESFAF